MRDFRKVNFADPAEETFDGRDRGLASIHDFVKGVRDPGDRVGDGLETEPAGAPYGLQDAGGQVRGRAYFVEILGDQVDGRADRTERKESEFPMLRDPIERGGGRAFQ